MEPVTHFLTGACIGRAGLNRRTAYATLAATLAAEAPDLDIVWGFAGPVTGLAHHRGISHTLIAAPVVALIITGFVWLLDRLWYSLRGSAAKHAREPIRWLWVYISAFLADLSHLVLDWTNNYGVRPFFPFNGRWFEGDLVFIAEPFLWILLVGALLIPSLLGLADREINRNNRARPTLRGRGWAVFALLAMLAFWSFRKVEQIKARNLVASSQITPTPASRITVEPYPINPFRWHALLETDTAWQVAEVDTRTGAVESDPRVNAILKPPLTPAIQVARRTHLGQVYLDWSKWPVIRDFGAQPVQWRPFPDMPVSGESTIHQWNAVEFSDLRFAYNYLDLGMGGGQNAHLGETLSSAGLSGWVYVLDGKEEAGMFMGGREQK